MPVKTVRFEFNAQGFLTPQDSAPPTASYPQFDRSATGGYSDEVIAGMTYDAIAAAREALDFNRN